MVSIFISYSSKNRPEIEALANDISSLGHQVWFDRELTGGHVWWESILKEVRGREVFLFALSKSSLDSYPCRLEYRYAYALKKNILPVLVSDEVSDNLLPPELSAIQYVNYRERNAEAALQLARALSLLPPPVPMPDPLPEKPEVPISQVGILRERIDSREVLNFEQQAGLIFQLKEEMDNPIYRADVLELLRRMHRRDDLLAKIAREIDSILEAENAAKPSPIPVSTRVVNNSQLVSSVNKSEPKLPATLVVEQSDYQKQLNNMQSPSIAIDSTLKPQWSNVTLPNFMIIAVTIALYLIIIYFLDVNYDNVNVFFVAWILLTLAQGYFTRWLASDRGLFDGSFSLLDIFYGGPFTFLLARRIRGYFKWRDLVLSVGGWALALGLAYIAGITYYTFVSQENFLEMNVNQPTVTALVTLAIVGGYVTGVVLRLAHKEAYEASIKS